MTTIGTWNLGTFARLLLAAFLIFDAVLALLGALLPGHAVSVGDLVSLIELAAGVLILIGR